MRSKWHWPRTRLPTKVNRKSHSCQIKPQIIKAKILKCIPVDKLLTHSRFNDWKRLRVLFLWLKRRIRYRSCVLPKSLTYSCKLSKWTGQSHIEFRMFQQKWWILRAKRWRDSSEMGARAATSTKSQAGTNFSSSTNWLWTARSFSSRWRTEWSSFSDGCLAARKDAQIDSQRQRGAARYSVRERKSWLTTWILCAW